MAIAMGWQKPDNVAGSSMPAIVIGLFVASGGILFGYDTGTINGVMVMSAFLKRFSTGSTDENGNPDLTTHQSSLLVAILSAGTFVGALLGAPMADNWGRRLSMLIGAGVFCIGGIMQVCASAIPLLLAGRFIAGVGVGAISLLVPLYQSEMAPKWIRGTLVFTYQLAITIGLLIASIVNILTESMDGPSAYRIPFGLQLLWAAILSAGLSVLPETPRYLIKRGDISTALISLSRLRRLDATHPTIIDELQEIVANHEYELTLGDDSYLELFRGSPHLGRRTLTGCFLQAIQQLTGVNFIMYYSISFFDGAGITNPYLKSLIINIVNTVSTIPGLFVIEAWGRRKLLIVGAFGMAACQLLIASFTTAAGDNLKSAAQTILIVFCSLYIFFFAASWGPVTWVVTSEIYPLKVRAKAMSLSTASNWLLNFIIAYCIPFMVGEGTDSAQIGPKVFFLWGAFCIVAIVFVWCMVYETSKISLEQIDEMYERIDFAWNSMGFQPTWSFQRIIDEGWSHGNIPPQPPAGDDSHPPPYGGPGGGNGGGGNGNSISNNNHNSTATTTSHDVEMQPPLPDTAGSTHSMSQPSTTDTNSTSFSSQAPKPPVMAHIDFSY
ncbi:putative glucose transporter rco-3 [Ceratocystis lukuohia]|uniref:Glucose transporter rco-3 n=2 Tax=Ceratocystis TaxID=5157 RepID=A0ABR4MAM0_9PEZI|nr:putative glucose transporter rco-3 [Ceratocystis platani]